MGNLPSILSLGILSHIRAERIPHDSIAMQEIQDRRAEKRLPNGRALHDYVNLYFNARNPMMYKRKEGHASLCVLRIRPDILELPGVMMADGNAAAGLTRFDPPDTGLIKLDEDFIFTDWWDDPDEHIKHERRRRICAEILVPDHVNPEYILGAYVSCDTSRKNCASTREGFDVIIEEHMFFLR